MTSVSESGRGSDFSLGIEEDVQISPLAAESVGVRSLALHVQTPDASILIDPGVALGFRDGHHPHPTEYRELSKRRSTILDVAEQVDLIVVSHYHHDHFIPFFQNYAYFWSNREEAIQLYRDKRVWCKDLRDNINWSQQRRGYNFVRGTRKIAQEVVYADGRALKLGATTIRFSPAVPHGEKGTKLGWVIMTSIRYGDVTICHASDIQGPIHAGTVDWIRKQNPRVLLLAGPPTYLVPDRVESSAIKQAAKNLQQLVQHIPNILVDHHLLRDPDWQKWVVPVQTEAESYGHQVSTVAKVIKEPERPLESQRVKLYTENPPSEAFEKWVKQIRRARTEVPPPLD